MDTKLIEHFMIPECAYPIIPSILTDTELEILRAFAPGESFSSLEVSSLLQLPVKKAENLLKSAYQRNILDIKELSNIPCYVVGTFYGRLGTFCQFEANLWNSFEEDLRRKIGDWYLQAFIDRTKPMWENDQRPDKVAPLEEALQFVRAHEGDFYLTKCDCRSIFGNCDHTLETCIGFSAEPNSPFHRGHARQITKEETLALVTACHQEGLIHTVESHGICNCCGDCCFEYRSADICGTIGTWPLTSTIAEWNQSKCIHCGICVKRCPMEAFKKNDKEIAFDSKRCIGCGVCIDKCPRSAITLEKR